MHNKLTTIFGTATLFLALAASLPAQWIKSGSYPLPATNAGLGGITTGPDGNLWVCQGYTSQGAIVRVTTSGVSTTFPLPDPDGGPVAITVGSDGALWFVNQDDYMVGRITTDGAISEYTIPTALATPGGITNGPDGALWFTEGGQGNRIARITTAGVFTEFAPLPTAFAQPIGIVTGSDGALWFTEFSGNKIGRMSTSGAVTEYPTPTAANPIGITSGPDGNLWFTYQSAAKIAKITTGGAFTEYPTRLSGNQGITPGPDGTLWFDGNTLGRSTTTGLVTEYHLPSTLERANSITTGPDHQLWFTGNLDAVVAYAPACAIGLSVGLSGHTLTVNFDIGTSEPAELRAYLVNDNGPRLLLSQSFSPTSVPVPLTDSVSVNPQIGVQGVESVLGTPTGAICSQGAFTN